MFIADMYGREIFPSNLAKQKLALLMEEKQVLLAADSMDNNRSLHIMESTIPSGGMGLFNQYIIAKKNATIGSVGSNDIFFYRKQ